MPPGTCSIEDTMNHCIRMVDLNGTITTIIGTGRKGFAGDGAPADTARLFQPSGMLLTPDGVLYVADSGNRVRRVVL
jgi:sugar lactone lactonase YvrE